MFRSPAFLVLIATALSVTVVSWVLIPAGQSNAVAADVVPAVAWEYKAVKFPPNDFTEQTKILNRLASSGWEYVGIIQSPYDYNGKFKPYSSVAYRRPSK